MIKKGVALGAGEIVLNSIDTDGTKDGFDLICFAVCDAVSVPVVASGAGGSVITLFKDVPGVDGLPLRYSTSEKLRSEL